MRLLRADGNELILETAYGENNVYAILSHRWLPIDEQEVRYADIVDQKPDLEAKQGWNELQWCRQQATADGLAHVWADTACIDKTSSQELTESINSMYQWYTEADVCYVYL
ncbi:Putative heterokaryon incompatibility [Septoria linicola]|uniref:Heterokaryon incompatibility n=1 Tax=Septoria linicola TaxID=215465 RepID=A0A9Q9AV77_9PEZI|nr:Putative heterokaryon incompatibility [Septoria linicola]